MRNMPAPQKNTFMVPIWKNPPICKRHHKYLGTKSIGSPKSQITMPKLITTYFIYTMFNNCYNEEEPYVPFYHYGESFPLITGMQDILYCYTLCTSTPKQFLIIFKVCYVVEIQMIDNDIITHWGFYSHRKDVYTFQHIISHLIVYFPSNLFFPFYKPKLYYLFNIFFSHKNISTSTSRTCFMPLYSNPTVPWLFVLNRVCWF